ncbi:uncharacterized protein V6R79_024842 [Siganus canaliculatus]
MKQKSADHCCLSSLSRLSQMGASCGEVDGLCLCEAGPCTLYSEAHTPTPDTLLCEHCGKNRVMITRYSEGYGTEEECVLSDPQGESDADADIEDTDCRFDVHEHAHAWLTLAWKLVLMRLPVFSFCRLRLQEPGSLQRISSRRRKRPRVARQDTTESEDDGGRSHRSHRWNLRLSPDRAKSRTILEESISQVRPLVICRPNVDQQKSPVQESRGSGRLMSLWPSSPSLPLILLISLPLSLSLVIVIVSFFLPWVRA